VQALTVTLELPTLPIVCSSGTERSGARRPIEVEGFRRRCAELGRPGCASLEEFLNARFYPPAPPINHLNANRWQRPRRLAPPSHNVAVCAPVAQLDSASGFEPQWLDLKMLVWLTFLRLFRLAKNSVFDT
jgi:hypothetical protein